MESEPPYQYVGGDPINNIDPSGYQTGVGEVALGGGVALACVATAPACSAAITAGAVVIGVTATAVIIYVAVDYLIQHPELGEVTYPAGPQPQAPAVPQTPPLISTPPACYWSADGCSPVSAIPETQPHTPPEPEPGPEPLIDIYPPIPPISTCTPEPEEKHISLGHAEAPRGEPNLPLFTAQLNRELNPFNVYVYHFNQWHLPGVKLADDEYDPFSTRFKQASQRAKGIHFSLDGIDDPNDAAERFGNNGIFTSRSIYTIVELFLIRERGYCSKTRFYRRNPPKVGGVWIESISDWIDFCTLTGQGRLSRQSFQN